MGIIVTNKSSNTISVSINQWGKDAKTGFYDLHPGKSEPWDRSDERGFVMSLKRSGSQQPYFVLHDSQIIVEDHLVKDNNQEIKPISRDTK